MRKACASLALSASVLAGAPGPACAGVHAHVDPVSGMVVLSNIAPTGRTAAPAPRRGQAGEAGAPIAFPRVSAQRQREMDGDRRAILQEELTHERRALAAASAARAASDVLVRHAANVAALQRELAAVTGK
ncbi:MULTISPECIES: hypothetical protein [Massilia]|uniref:DUF4398 domain-containing protein n=1 Tax=Massilia haematophila TaxID=457923 RepID=A0ABV7PHW8_9BURK|nr:hypothetical protein [Massilia sp.]